jgi:hypothetical protein
MLGKEIAMTAGGNNTVHLLTQASFSRSFGRCLNGKNPIALLTEQIGIFILPVLGGRLLHTAIDIGDVHYILW